MPIRAVHRGALGRRYMGRRRGSLFALLPAPVDADACLAEAGFADFADSEDAWDDELEALISTTVTTMTVRFGDPDVTVHEPPTHPPWLQRLDSFLGGLLLWRSRPKPTARTPTLALQTAAQDDQPPAFAHVGFGAAAHRHGEPHRAGVFTSDGHPIIWVWLEDSVADAWPDIAREIAGPLPCSEIDLAWERLLPSFPLLSREPSRVAVHRGDAATWTDGDRVLGFQAGLGVTPPQVYLPPESQWRTHAPSWAATLRPAIVRDLQTFGLRVVELRDATAFERDR
ncbi:hypothetical protein [Enhygromyxa salina]|uniref:Uncharacterized protein n=1 Tax=Enhygromyxa salina TaxID=215803 RepID=A0A2S9YT68_9BACT|nr:hypothetical protein [Enhygromyxa salina]PRQ08284.1 hypothetical protein ENSA7_19070 [Enhygromyxa salina]